MYYIYIYIFIFLRLLYHVWRALNVLLNTPPLSVAKTNKSLAKKVSDFIVSAIWNIFRDLNHSLVTACYQTLFRFNAFGFIFEPVS